MLRMERFSFKRLCSCFVLLFVLVHDTISMAVPCRPVSSGLFTDNDLNEKNVIFTGENPPCTDIFETILKANAKSSTTGSDSSHGEGNTGPFFQGDILMTKEERLAVKARGTDTLTLPQRERVGRAVNGNYHAKWPAVNGLVRVPYVIEDSSDSDQLVIHQALNHWTDKVPCIAFVPRNRQEHYLSFFKGRGCFSWVGRKGRKQRISIGSGCAVMGVVAHEIGHALGFWHEQARPDRDKYVRILWDNIMSDNLDDFKKIDGSDTNDLGVQYDLASLMHYGPKAFAKNPSVNTIETLDGRTNFGQRNGLSDKDIEQARLLYCNGSNVCGHQDDHNYTSSCPWWADMGYCHSSSEHYLFMMSNCKRSCYCSYVCEDKTPNCPSRGMWKSLCTDPVYEKYMSLFCRRSCKLCDAA